MKIVVERIYYIREMQYGRRVAVLAEDQESLQILCVLMDSATEIFLKLHMRDKMACNHN